MLNSRHEEYKSTANSLPFVLNCDLTRTYYKRSKEHNWHENLEIQFCTDGKGTVLLDGESFDFSKNDIAVVNSDVLHYTGSDGSITYSCIIIDTDFCKQLGFDPTATRFSPIVKNLHTAECFKELLAENMSESSPAKKIKLTKCVLEILTDLLENHQLPATIKEDTKKYETVRRTISYLRENYAKRLSLDDISKAVLCDKYALCREFKKMTGQTVIENLNNYRCIMATEYLNDGYSVAETAGLCGFQNLSFFTKTFKKYIGTLPSGYKKG